MNDWKETSVEDWNDADGKKEHPLQNGCQDVGGKGGGGVILEEG